MMSQTCMQRARAQTLPANQVTARASPEMHAISPHLGIFMCRHDATCVPTFHPMMGPSESHMLHADLPPSVPQAELEDEDMGPLPPGIEVEPGTQQAASGGGGSGKPPLISISLEPDEELEKEVARLFGQEHARLSPSGATTLQSQPAETRSTGDDDAVQKLLRWGTRFNVAMSTTASDFAHDSSKAAEIFKHMETAEWEGETAVPQIRTSRMQEC